MAKEDLDLLDDAGGGDGSAGGGRAQGNVRGPSPGCLLRGDGVPSHRETSASGALCRFGPHDD